MSKSQSAQRARIRRPRAAPVPRARSRRAIWQLTPAAERAPGVLRPAQQPGSDPAPAMRRQDVHEGVALSRSASRSATSSPPSRIPIARARGPCSGRLVAPTKSSSCLGRLAVVVDLARSPDARDRLAVVRGPSGAVASPLTVPAGVVEQRLVDEPLDRRLVVGVDVPPAQRALEPPRVGQRDRAQLRAAAARPPRTRRARDGASCCPSAACSCRARVARDVRERGAHRRRQHLLELRRVLGMADVDDHRAAWREPVARQLEELLASRGRTGCRAGDRCRGRSSRSAPRVRRRNGRASSACTRSCGRSLEAEPAPADVEQLAVDLDARR